MNRADAAMLGRWHREVAVSRSNHDVDIRRSNKKGGPKSTPIAKPASSGLASNGQGGPRRGADQLGRDVGAAGKGWPPAPVLKSSGETGTC
jgi:hypothetical protein